MTNEPITGNEVRELVKEFVNYGEHKEFYKHLPVNDERARIYMSKCYKYGDEPLPRLRACTVVNAILLAKMEHIETKILVKDERLRLQVDLLERMKDLIKRAQAGEQNKNANRSFQKR